MTIQSSPFIQPNSSVLKIMAWVIACLVPGILLYIYACGWGVLINIIICLIGVLFFEFLMLLILGKPIKNYLFDGSALVTALLLALALPPLVVWWVPLVGCFFAIVVVKQLYGGLGFNIFNPAMAAYIVLLISFPLPMTTWVVTEGANLPLSDSLQLVFDLGNPGVSFDAISAATTLDHIRNLLSQQLDLQAHFAAPLFEELDRSPFSWINLLFLGGGIILIYKRIITWHVPVAMLVSLWVVASAFHIYDPSKFSDPWVHVFIGAGVLGAFFIATDPVTSPSTAMGKLIYGAGVGVLTYMIRTIGNYPDGVAFAVILMGLTVPLLDQYTIPKAFGMRSKSRE